MYTEELARIQAAVNHLVEELLGRDLTEEDIVKITVEDSALLAEFNISNEFGDNDYSLSIVSLSTKEEIEVAE